MNPTAVVLDRLLGAKACYYADLLPTLLRVNSQLAMLHSVTAHLGKPVNGGPKFSYHVYP